MVNSENAGLLNVTISDVMVGASLMGSISVDRIPYLLSGQMDRQISIFMYYRQYERLPTRETDLNDVWVVQMLERLKGLYRDEITRLMVQEDRADAQSRKRAQAEAAKRFVGMNQPAEEGSVDELAKRYGVSKSHVRRLKREGRLNELLQTPAEE